MSVKLMSVAGCVSLLNISTEGQHVGKIACQVERGGTCHVGENHVRPLQQTRSWHSRQTVQSPRFIQLQLISQAVNVLSV